MYWYIKVWKNFAVFDGRARRKEYWMFFLINVLISFALGFFDGFTGMYNDELGLGVISGIYSLAILVPSIAVGVRRLHDTGKSGWWFLTFLIPVIGIVAWIILLATPGDEGSNKYGEDPMMVEEPK